LNFETLLVPDQPSMARHYWIEDLTIQIAPSLAMLQPATAGAAGGSPASLLLVGNAPARAPEFPALSYAPAEMDAVQKHFAPSAVSVFDGEHASPAAFKGAAPERFSVIHFTSHAVANPESPLDSAVILSGPDHGYKLYARDVAALPLTSELVTVSACRSAGERAYAGEGLVGFAWAFLRAGSRRVVAGLWDVDDRSTAALMEQMYERIAAGDSPPAALREAKRMLIKKGYAKPYYWAPFQMFTIVI
jgi:CHAT domain-containing protein